MWSQVPDSLIEFSSKRRDLLTTLITIQPQLRTIDSSEPLLKTLTLSDYVFTSLQSYPAIALQLPSVDFLNQPLAQEPV